jgi:hypothetical protein
MADEPDSYSAGTVAWRAASKATCLAGIFAIPGHCTTTQGGDQLPRLDNAAPVATIETESRSASGMVIR